MKLFIRLMFVLAIVGMGYVLIEKDPNILGEITGMSEEELKELISEKMERPTIEWDDKLINRQLEIGNDSLYIDGSIKTNVETRVFAKPVNNSYSTLEIVLSSITPFEEEGAGFHKIVDDRHLFVENDWIVLEKSNGVEVYATLINKINSDDISGKILEIEIDEGELEHRVFSTVRIVDVVKDSINPHYNFFEKGSYKRTSTWLKASRYGI